MTILILIVALSLAAVAIFSMIRPIAPPALAAFAALWVSSHFRLIWLSSSQILFWGIATMLLVVINTLSPPDNKTYPTAARIYSAVGAIIGTLLGLIINPDNSGMIIGATIGTIAATYAFSRLPGSTEKTKFLKSHFFNYLCRVGLSDIITCCILAIPICQYFISTSD